MKRWFLLITLLSIGLACVGPVPLPSHPTAAPVTPKGDRVDGAELLYAPNPPASAQNPAFSPDGQTLLFTLFHEGYNNGPAGLYLLPFAGAVPVALLDEDDQDSVNLPGSSWSAATNRITCASDRQDTDEVWTMDASGSDLFRVTHHTAAGYSIEPSFSPDGQWIAFEANTDAPEDEQQGSIWKVRADGTELTQLTDGPGGGTDDRQPNWSPSGDRVLFQRRAPGSDDWDLYTIAPDGTDIRPVTTTSSSDTDASWSPDGRWTVYSSDYGGLPVPNIFIVPAEGGTPIRVTRDDTHEDGAPSWSPDGKWIAFESHPGQDEDTPASLWRIAVPSSICLPLILRGFTVSPHGQAVVSSQYLGVGGALCLLRSRRTVKSVARRLDRQIQPEQGATLAPTF